MIVHFVLLIIILPSSQPPLHDVPHCIEDVRRVDHEALAHQLGVVVSCEGHDGMDYLLSLCA